MIMLLMGFAGINFVRFLAARMRLNIDWPCICLRLECPKLSHARRGSSLLTQQSVDADFGAESY